MDSDLIMKKDRDDQGSPDRDRGRERERSRRGDRPSRFSSNTRDRSPVRERRRPGDRRVYVSNVAYESKWQDIKDLFRAEVGEVTYVELFVDEHDKPRGCGIVEFETPELASRAVQKMHRFDLKGRKLVVKEDSDVDRDKYGRPLPSRGIRSGSEREQHGNSGGSANRRDDLARTSTWDGNASANLPPSVGVGNSNAAKWGNTYGLSPSFLESLWITGPLVSKVFVANLDYKVDEKKLREVFRLAGRVIHAEISMDKEGKSRGFGVVEYEHPVEAVQAISLFHNQTLFDRRLTVRMDRVEKPDGPPKLPEGLKSIGSGLGVNGAILNDVPRNLHIMTNANAPLSGLGANMQQQLQAAAVAQAQVQLAQGAQLGQPSLNAISQGPLAHLAGSNTLAPNLTNMSNLLSQSLNVSDLANLSASQPFAGSAINPNQLNPSLAPGLAGLNPAIASGLTVGGSALGTNFNAMNNQNSMMGGNNPNSFNNSGSGLQSPSTGFGQTRDFDSMSAALSGTNSSGYNSYDRDNFRGSGNPRENIYNGSSRVLGNGNGRGNFGNNLHSGGRQNDTVVVKNLPPNTAWQHLMEKFRDVGEIISVDMQGKDAGVIRFRDAYEADRAVQWLEDAERFRTTIIRTHDSLLEETSLTKSNVSMAVRKAKLIPLAATRAIQSIKNNIFHSIKTEPNEEFSSGDSSVRRNEFVKMEAVISQSEIGKTGGTK